MDGITLFALFVLALLVLDVAATTFGVDSRFSDPS